jgi:hypothetical protein
MVSQSTAFEHIKGKVIGIIPSFFFLYNKLEYPFKLLLLFFLSSSFAFA